MKYADYITMRDVQEPRNWKGEEMPLLISECHESLEYADELVGALNRLGCDQLATIASFIRRDMRQALRYLDIEP